ncbi:MAG: protein-disulfide reductase DsbD domain-containing protein [Pseudomonadota bacterium]
MRTRWAHTFGISLGFSALAALASPVAAQSLVSTGESFVNARFLPGIPEESGARISGLRLSLKDGWKTYWRSPGEAGIPPRFDWSESENVKSAEVLWPRPKVYMSFGMETIGYSDQVVLPIRMTPVDPNLPMHVSGTVDMGVCREICVLERFTVSETIMPDTPSIGTRQITHAVAQVPPAATEVGLISAECAIVGAGETRDLNVGLVFKETLETPVVLFEGTEHAWINKAKTYSELGQIRATAKVHMASESGWFDRGTLRMTVLADGFSAEIHGCTAPAG